MDKLKRKKQNQKKYALISLLQILLIVSLPTYTRLIQELNVKTGIQISGYVMFGCIFIGCIGIKRRIKAKARI